MFARVAILLALTTCFVASDAQNLCTYVGLRFWYEDLATLKQCAVLIQDIPAEAKARCADLSKDDAACEVVGSDFNRCIAETRGFVNEDGSWDMQQNVAGMRAFWTANGRDAKDFDDFIQKCQLDGTKIMDYTRCVYSSCVASDPQIAVTGGF